MSKLTREDFYILNPFYRGMNNEEPLYEQDVTSRLQAIKQVKSVDGCIAALKTPGLQHTVEIAIVRKMKSLLKADGAEAHKRNTALTVELNEFCQQQGIGKIGESIVPALKTYIKNIQGSLDLTERLIVSEIGDFTVGLGNLGEPQTPEQIHEQLMARVQRVFIDIKLQESPTEEVNTKTAVFDVIAERRRQQVEEGYGPENDDIYIKGELAAAAACYADKRIAGYIWPWSSAWYKPNFNRKDLVKAAALLIAEIERIDRLNAKAGAK